MSASLSPGDALPPQVFVVRRSDLVRYAEASGDHNPIHQDEDVADGRTTLSLEVTCGGEKVLGMPRAVLRA